MARLFGNRPVAGRDIATTFLRWTYLRAVFHRGYVLVSSLYFVVDAHLSAGQLVVLGTVMSVTLVLWDVPTGVWSDAIGRKSPLVIGHAFMAAGMVMTGLVAAIVASGVAMAILGPFVAARFTEDNFTPTRERRWSASLSIFRRGLTLARQDNEIWLVFAATMIINGERNRLAVPQAARQAWLPE